MIHPAHTINNGLVLAVACVLQREAGPVHPVPEPALQGGSPQQLARGRRPQPHLPQQAGLSPSHLILPNTGQVTFGTLCTYNNDVIIGGKS